MDSISIKKIVDRQLDEKGITDRDIYILEKDWGYVVQVDYGKMSIHYLNEVFDKDGNIIYPLGNFEYDSGGIYSTEIARERSTSKYRKEMIVFAESADVRYKELDNNHFIIPRHGKAGVENALFFINENGEVEVKGTIEGRLSGNAINENRQLMAQKQLLSEVEIDKTKDEYEYFFYSWDKNCEVSDRWSNLIEPDDFYRAENILINRMKVPLELGIEIVEYMQSHEAWLATLNIYSKDYKHHRDFICLVGIDGKPLIDLTYITPKYELDKLKLRKGRIGEVNQIKEILQAGMNKRIMEIEENKQNLTANFFHVTGLTTNAPREEALIDKKVDGDVR